MDQPAQPQSSTQHSATEKPSSAVLHEHKKKQALLLAAMGLLLLSFSIGMLYFFSQKTVEQSMENQVISQPQISSIQINKPTVQPNQQEYSTENWKTYSNTTFHFAINYPPDWKYSDSSAGDLQVLFTSVNDKTEIIELIVSPGATENYIEDLCKSTEEDYKCLATNEPLNITVGGMHAKQITTIHYSPIISILNKSVIYQLGIPAYKKTVSPINKQVFEQMVTTFRFLN